MLDYTQIKAIAEEHAREAEENGLVPTRLSDINLREPFPLPFPFLGEYVPEGWEIMKDIDGNQVTWLCDSSGFGDEDEPALTANALIERLHQWKVSGKVVGFGIVEAGAFQVIVGLYVPDHRDFTRSGSLRESELRRFGRKS